MIQGVAVGTLGEDVTATTAATGKRYARFPVACKSGYEKASHQEKVCWIRAILWEPSHTLLPYLKKGARIGFSFRCEQTTWIDKQGIEHNDILFVIQPGSLELITSPLPPTLPPEEPEEKKLPW